MVWANWIQKERTESTRAQFLPQFFWITATISLTGNMDPECARRTLSGIWHTWRSPAKFAPWPVDHRLELWMIIHEEYFTPEDLLENPIERVRISMPWWPPVTCLDDRLFGLNPPRSCRYQQSLRRISDLTCECTSAEIRLECGCSHVNGRSTNLCQVCVSSTAFLHEHNPSVRSMALLNGE